MNIKIVITSDEGYYYVKLAINRTGETEYITLSDGYQDYTDVKADYHSRVDELDKMLRDFYSERYIEVSRDYPGAEDVIQQVLEEWVEE